jgi:hypothetical protein
MWIGATKPTTLPRIWFLNPTTTAKEMSITVIANATLVTARRITVEERLPFESEKSRLDMNLVLDMLYKTCKDRFFCGNSNKMSH